MPRTLPALLAMFVLLLLAVTTVADIAPPARRPAGSPGFDVVRAQRDIARFSARPHILGSAEQARSRDYLVGRFRALGLRTEVQSEVGQIVRDAPGLGTSLGHAANVVAVLPGTHPTGRVIVAAHYDSVPAAPGANDDGAGVASALETARRLVHGGTRPRNDIVFLLTDGEEFGSIGAEAFTARHPLGRGPSVVVNNEAGGAAGPLVLLRTTSPNGALIRTMLGSGARPAANSLLADLFAFAGNSTDLTAFDKAGLPVTETAYAGYKAAYHSRIDDPRHIDPPTLQHMGDTTAAQVTAFGAADLTRAKKGGTELAYLSVPPGWTLTYPAGLAPVLGVLALAATVALIVLARRRGLVSVPRVLLGAGLGVLPLLLAVAAGAGLWPLLTVVRPAYASVLAQAPHRPQLYQAAMLALALTVLLAWYALLRRRVGAGSLATGVLALLAVMAAGLCFVLPAIAHVLAIPVIGAALGGIAATWTPPRLRPVVLAAGLVPAMISPAAWAWNVGLFGLSGVAAVAAALAVVTGALALPLIELAWPRRRVALVPVTALVLSAAMVATGLAIDPVDRDHPLSTMLRYRYDADTGRAAWMSTTADDWNSRYAGTKPSGVPATTREWWGLPVPTGFRRDAPVAAIPAPGLKVLGGRTSGGHRTVRVRITPRRPTNGLAFQTAPGAARLDAIKIADRTFPTACRPSCIFWAPPRHGLVATLRLAGTGPVRLRVADTSFDPGTFRAVPGYRPPPADRFLDQDTESIVTKTYSLR